MRVPGIGIQSTKKICSARKFGRVTWEHLKKFGIAMNRTKYFILTDHLFEKKDWQTWQIKQFIYRRAIANTNQIFHRSQVYFKMNIVVYDKTFEGLLTAVFEVYEYKFKNALIYKEGEASGSLFGACHIVETNLKKSERVWTKLESRLSKNSMSQLYKTFLSELKDIENNLLRYIQYVIASKYNVENDYGHPDILMVQQTSKKVDREKHRMEGFVRFQYTKDELYYSIIQPDFNVLPLISDHFEKRYADQRWLIYDSLRKVGLYYDLEKVEQVSMQFETDMNNKEALRTIFDENEELYQTLWQQYFTSVNIKARKNMKLHIQHMPKRYWKNLVEKKG